MNSMEKGLVLFALVLFPSLSLLQLGQELVAAH